MINFKTGNEPKMKLFDFGAFQNFKQMLSHDKIIFHMLFGAFQVTPRISVTCQSVYISSEQFRAAYNEHWLSILSVIQIH